MGIRSLFTPSGRATSNRQRGAIGGGGLGGGTGPALRGSSRGGGVNLGLLLNVYDRFQNAQDEVDRVRKYNSAKTWFANDLFMRKIMSFDEAARIFDALGPKAAVEKFQVDPALPQLQGEENFNILQGLGLGKTPNQATSQPQTPTSGQTQTPTSIPPQTSTLPPGSFSYEDPSTPLNDEGRVGITLEKSMPPLAEPPAQTQTLPSTPTPTQQPQPKTLSNILQDFMRRGTPPTGPHAQPVSPEDLALLDEYYERNDEEVIQELIREDEERNNGRPVSPEKEEEIRNFVEGAVARQEDYIEKKDRAFFEQQAQIKKLRQARSAAALAQEDPRTNPLAALMQQKTGVSGDGTESQDDILKGLSAEMQGDLRSLFPQIPKGIPITRSLVNRLIPIATAQKFDRDIKVFRSEVKGKLDITADFKDNRPIEPTDVKNMIGPHGQILTDPNMTYREARALGFVAVPESIRKKVGKITSAAELLKQFRILIPKVFTNNGDDIIASGIRFRDGIVRRTQVALKTNPDIILYQALSESLVTLFRAPVGESGAPSNFDIERLKKAIPSPISTFAEPFVMNRKTALEQMEVMEEIFEADIKASTGGEINPTSSLQRQKKERVLNKNGIPKK
jgi:hypothetical protein